VTVEQSFGSHTGEGVGGDRALTANSTVDTSAVDESGLIDAASLIEGAEAVDAANATQPAGWAAGNAWRAAAVDHEAGLGAVDSDGSADSEPAAEGLSTRSSGDALARQGLADRGDSGAAAVTDASAPSGAAGPEFGDGDGLEPAAAASADEGARRDGGASGEEDGVPGSAAGEGSGGPVQAELDELADPGRLRSAVEAVLLVIDTPTSAQMLAQVLGRSVPEVELALRSLRDEYDAGGRGFDLREVADGWRLYSRDEFAAYVERFVLDGQRARLTHAALETLAVIAYRQPVTRSRISGIRGVSVDAVMRTLLTRGLVEECGADPDTGGGLYRTTSLFLEKMGLRSLDELPSLAPLLPDTSQLDDVELST
jgi:segregation and condensation protein B